MGFWVLMLFMNMLVPLTMIGFGVMFLHHIPTELNMAFGYCTKMSTKNQDTWEFAHQYCGKLWVICGLALLPLSNVPMLFVIGQSEDVVGNLTGVICIVQCVILTGTIFPTERALRKNFDQNGIRR